jgi:hypothetical protein
MSLKGNKIVINGLLYKQRQIYTMIASKAPKVLKHDAQMYKVDIF